MYQTDHDKFHLLDAKTGETIWDAPRRFHYSPATITDDLVLIKPYGTSIFAVDRQTGKEPLAIPWQDNLGLLQSGRGRRPRLHGNGSGSPGDLESVLAFQHGHGKESPRERGITGTLHVIDLKTGKSVWRIFDRQHDLRRAGLGLWKGLLRQP